MISCCAQCAIRGPIVCGGLVCLVTDLMLFRYRVVLTSSEFYSQGGGVFSSGGALNQFLGQTSLERVS